MTAPETDIPSPDGDKGVVRFDVDISVRTARPDISYVDLLELPICLVDLRALSHLLEHIDGVQQAVKLIIGRASSDVLCGSRNHTLDVVNAAAVSRPRGSKTQTATGCFGSVDDVALARLQDGIHRTTLGDVISELDLTTARVNLKDRGLMRLSPDGSIKLEGGRVGCVSLTEEGADRGNDLKGEWIIAPLPTGDMSSKFCGATVFRIVPPSYSSVIFRSGNGVNGGTLTHRSGTRLTLTTFGNSGELIVVSRAT